MQANTSNNPALLPNGHIRSWILYSGLSIFLLVALVALWYLGQPVKATTPVVVTKPKVTFTLPAPLYGKAAIVYDIQTGETLFERNSEMQLPLASITKVMTALVAAEKLNPTDTVVINENALAEDGPSGLYAGERWSFKNLLNFTLISSSNDGAHAIASAAGALELKAVPGSSSDTDEVRAFVKSMNTKAEQLGLAQTYFLNPTGLDLSAGQGGAYGSARDVSTLMSYILKSRPELLTETRLPAIAVADGTGEVKRVKNTNDSVGKFPLLIASKTGFTDLAGGNLAIAVDAGLAHPVVIVILGSTEEGRFVDAKNLVDATLGYFAKQSE